MDERLNVTVKSLEDVTDLIKVLLRNDYSIKIDTEYKDPEFSFQQKVCCGYKISATKPSSPKTVA